MSLVKHQVFVRYEGPVVDGRRTPVLIARGPKVTMSEAPMVYGPSVEIDGETYDLLMAQEDSTRALAVRSNDLVWIPYLEFQGAREQELTDPRMVDLVDGVWMDH